MNDESVPSPDKLLLENNLYKFLNRSIGQITQANNQSPKDTSKLVQLNLDKAFWVQLQISLEHQIEVMRKAPDDQKMKIRINTEY